MKKVFNYLLQFQRKHFDLRLYVGVAIFLTVLLVFNYTLDFENGYLDKLRKTPWHFLAMFLWQGLPYLLTCWLIYFSGKNKEWLRSKEFWLMFFIGFGVLALDRSFYGHYLLRPYLQPVEFVYIRKCLGWLSSLLTTIIPLLLLSRYIEDRNESKYYGLNFKKFDVTPYFQLLGIAVVFIIIGSFFSDIQDYYPRYAKSRGAQFALLHDLPEVVTMLIYELAYGSNFLSVEMIFRGFLIFAFVRTLGGYAVLPMAVTYCVLHFGKPWPEAFSSIFGGYILGVVSLNTRNIWGGVIIHLGVAWSMEFFGYLQRFSNFEPMDVTTIVILILGMAATGGLGFVIGKSQRGEQATDESPRLRAELEMEQKRGTQRDEEFREINNQLKEEREKYIDLNGAKSRLEADYKNLEIRLQEQKKELQDIQTKFSIEFKNLANEILEEKSKKFTDQNQKNLGELLGPLKERIEGFEKKVEQNSKESLEQNTALKAQLQHIKELNQRMTKEAESLTNALKGDSKAQGNWGEIQLELILEKVGLQRETHYFKEKSFKSEDGSIQRLDYIIKLPDNKYLVLDSKVSLTAYSNYFEADDEATQAKYLKQHLDSVHNHIKILGDKNYQNLYDIQQPDFVLMFVANEPALTTALREDQSLYEKALDKNIVLVSTSTLLATMRTVSYIWKQDLQNKNALEIARQAGALYDKFVNFTEDLVKVGKQIDDSKKSYSEAMKKLYDGTGNLVTRTEKLKKLGAKAAKQMDQRLLDRATEQPKII